MLKGQLFQTLNQYLGEYLYGFNPEQLKLAVLNGNIKLKNLTFRPDKINDHLLMARSPVLLKAGIIGNITIDLNYIDWSKNEIVLEDLLLIIGPNFSELKTRKDYVSNEQDFLNLANKLEEYLRQGMETNQKVPERKDVNIQEVISHENELNRIYKQHTGGSVAAPNTQPKSEKAEDQNAQKKKNSNAYENLKTNLPEEKRDLFSIILGLDILTTQRFVAKNIHIRYEDDQLVPRHPISFGFLIDSILLHPNPNMDIFIPSSKDSQALGYYNTEKKVLDDFWKASKERKNLVQQLLINGVEIYFNSTSEMYIPYSLYEQTLFAPNGIFEAIPPLELKTLMKQYLEHDDMYKFTLFKIERIELHYMISSNLKPAPNRQNFVLLSNTLYNVYLNVKPDCIEDLMDIMSYFKHFAMWKHFNDFKPNIRPVLNSRIVNSKPATQKLRKIILKEWWKSMLWYLRVKRLLEEDREEVVYELYDAYCKSSMIKILEDFKPQSRRQSSARNYPNYNYNNNYENPMMASEFSKPIWDQGQPRKIFHDEEIKENVSVASKHTQGSEAPSQKSADTKELLKKIQDILIMVFCNVYNINIALKKNNGKTFLLMRIDQSHISALKNYDFKDSNVATFQVSNIRVFLCQSEKTKKIFEGGTVNNPSEAHQLIQEATLKNTKQATLIQHDLKGIERVMGGTSLIKKSPFPQTSQILDLSNTGPGLAKNQSNFSNLGSLVPLPPQGLNANKSSSLVPLEKLPSQGNAGIFANPVWKTDATIQNAPTIKEADTRKPFVKPSTDLLLLELKNDIILKVETRPSVGKGIQFQTKIEINEINIKIDSEILIDIFEYYNEIQRIYYMRLVRFAKYMEEGMETLKYQAEKKVIVFQRPQGGSIASNNFSPNQNNIMIRDERQNRSHNSFDSRQQLDDRSYMNKPPMYEGVGSEQYFQGAAPSGELENTDIFINKLSDFLECNEFLVSLNFDGLHVTLSENSHTLDSRSDLMNIQIPKGKVNVSFNFNKKNAYIVDVFGFRVETSSKFKALHFLFKKIQNLVESGMDTEIEKQMFFGDFLEKKGILRHKVDSQVLRDHYRHKNNF